MQLFCVKPAIHCVDRFSEFLREFSVGESDLLLTETLLYEQYIKREKPACRVLLKDQYDPGEPKEEAIDAILRDMEGFSPRRIIAVGGGSVIDIAKLLCVRGAYPVRRVVEQQIPLVLDKELIALPTTCGTGSEVTFGGIVTMKESGLKTAVMAPALSATHAVLVPELLSTLPWGTFLHCSADALAHAMESYVSATRGNELARAVGGRAIRLLLDGYAALALEGAESRAGLLKQFLTASCLAGMAVNNGGAGPVHALAYPVGERCRMSHGESIRQFLTEVFVHYERTADGPLLEELRGLLRPALERAGVFTGSSFTDLGVLLERLHPARRLRQCGMAEADIAPFVEGLWQTKQRLLSAAYAPFTKEDAASTYRRRL